ncbi:MAG: hypothetical protein QM656_06035 [Paracoccaceae bacterium]
MRPIAPSLALIAVLAGCGPRAAIPAAAHFAETVAAAEAAVRAPVDKAAAADLASQRDAALDRGARYALLPPDCRGYFTMRPGLHLSDCPAELPIHGLTPAPTPAGEAKLLLDVYAAFGRAMKALATSQAPAETAAAVAEFSTRAKALAKEFDQTAASAKLAAADPQLPTFQAMARALTRAAQAGSICRQMTAGREAFEGATQGLRVYVSLFIDKDPTRALQLYDATFEADNRTATEVHYRALRAAAAKSPEARLDAAAIAFEQTLAACNARP